jgi:tetratricopeptide (TPR) repeat protein
LGHLTCQRGNYEDALLWYQQCLKTAKDPSVVAEAMSGLGKVALAHGDFDQAEHWLSQCLEASRQAEADRPAALAWSQMGLLEQRRQEFRKASAHFAKALRLFEKAGDAPSQGELHLHLGQLSEAQGRPDKAQEAYEQAAAIFQQCREAQRLELARQSLSRMQQAARGGASL